MTKEFSSNFAPYIESMIRQKHTQKNKACGTHIFTDAQLEEFFRFCDSLKKVKYPPYRHLVAPMIFRMIYCCGLRNSEACHLKYCDINLHDGTIKVYESKGHKNRIVYMTEDLTKLCYKYDSVMETILPGREYFFPSSRVDYYKNTSVCKLFDSILKRHLSVARQARNQPAMGLDTPLR